MASTPKSIARTKPVTPASEATPGAKKPGPKVSTSRTKAITAAAGQAEKGKKADAKKLSADKTGAAVALANEKKSTKPPAEDKSISDRWGKDLTAAGWTAVPNVLFEYSQELGLKTLDMVIILHLAGYWWRKGNDPFPSKATLARKIGVEPRTVQRAVAELEAKGYIERTKRYATSGGNLSNSYSFEGLIKKARSFAKQMIADREAKAVATSRKKPARATATASH